MFKVGDIIKLKISDRDSPSVVAVKNIFRARIMSINIEYGIEKLYYNCLVLQSDGVKHLPVGRTFINSKIGMDTYFLIDKDNDEEML